MFSASGSHPEPQTERKAIIRKKMRKRELELTKAWVSLPVIDRWKERNKTRNEICIFSFESMYEWLRTLQRVFKIFSKGYRDGVWWYGIYSIPSSLTPPPPPKKQIEWVLAEKDRIQGESQVDSVENTIFLKRFLKKNTALLSFSVHIVLLTCSSYK